MTKYSNSFERIKGFIEADIRDKPDYATKDFDLHKLNGSWFAKKKADIQTWILNHVLIWVMQVSPLISRIVAKLTKIHFVTRYDDVVTILGNPDIFNVPFGHEMENMTSPPKFALGDDGEFHTDQMSRIYPVWLGAELGEHTCPRRKFDEDTHLNLDLEIRKPVDLYTRARLKDSGGKIDVSSGIFMPVCAQSAFDVFGIEPTNPDDFAAYFAACSALIFGDVKGSRAYWEQAMIGAKAVNAILDQSIHNYTRLSPAQRADIQDKKVLHKLMESVACTNSDGENYWPIEAKNKVRTMLFGVLTGYVPTTALGAGKMLDYLRKHPILFNKARALAVKADQVSNDSNASDEDKEQARDALQTFLLEVGRFNPSLSPGQFRVRNEEHDGAELPEHLKRIPKGATILVCSAAAVRDPRKMKHPHSFNPKEGFLDKNGERIGDLTFGYGRHWCFGEYTAHALITTMFQALLSQPNLSFEREKPLFFGPYPGRIRMRFDVETGHIVQQMMNAAIPLAANCDIAGLKQLLAELQADGSPLKDALDETRIVHFCSLNTADLGDDVTQDAAPTHLLVEMNVDGTQKSSLSRIDSLAGTELNKLLKFLGNTQGRSFVGLARSYMLEFKTRPWGTTGLAFPGTEDMSVAQILDEHALFMMVRSWVTGVVDAARVARAKKYSPRPSALTNNNPDFVADKGDQFSLDDGNPSDINYLDPLELLKRIRTSISSKPDFDWLLYRPQERAPGFARHEPVSFQEFPVKYFYQYRWLAAGAIGLTILIPLVLVLVCIVGVWQAFNVYVALWIAPLLLGVTLFIGLLAWLRFKENSEKPDDRFAEHAHVAAVQATEDLAGSMQNHITSVSPMKRGFFRRFTFALALYIVKQMKIHWFRPGFVTDFATIHYARWFRPKGTNKLIFQAHYDGSWESYLEDFITKVHQGQTIAWNNAEGFPKTEWYSRRGAEDGDAFKRWVRRQQIVPNFWYSAYPNLTTGMIRTNAQVRDGLARVTTHDEAKTWVDLFSSTHRPQTSLETEEIQTLLFHGLGRHRHMQAFVIRFCDEDGGKEWLNGLVKESFNAEERGVPKAQTLAFGDSYPNMDPSFVGFTAAGLKFLGLPDDTPHHGMASLPHAFAQGMSQRGRVLGDDAPASWLWGDFHPDNEADGTKGAHAIWLCYTREENKMLSESDIEELRKGRFEILHQIYCKLERKKKRSDDAFGIKDGIAQPVMTGTQAFAQRNMDHDDIVGPGEFVLGYPDSRAEMPLTITVPGRDPAAKLLPSTQPLVEEQIANFGRERLDVVRDFGRNGSFLAVRHMLHNRDRFEKFVTDFAKSRYPEDGSEVSGFASIFPSSPSKKTGKFHVPKSTAKDVMPSSEVGRQAWAKQWVAAKMVGRWADGSSLTRNPAVSLTVRNRARFYSRIRRRLKQRLPKDKRDWTSLTEYEKIVADFYLAMGPFGSELSSQLKWHPDKVIWDQESWRKFIEEFEILESKGEPFDLPRRLLRPIVPDNDFRHGRDDPKGLYCPIGAHIRRANPRDSFNPDNQTALDINKRHRLLRRGRTYSLSYPKPDQLLIDNNWLVNDTENGKYNEEGTLFMCFNANLERQFEFVQQTWLNSRVFHDGRDMPDPLVTPKQEDDKFFIPQSSNTVILDMHKESDGKPAGHNDFVKTIAGGYFFFPGRQAISYLSQLPQAKGLEPF